MSDGGRNRASLGVGVWKSSQKWSVQRSAVRSIAWLDALLSAYFTNPSSQRHNESAPRETARHVVGHTLHCALSQNDAVNGVGLVERFDVVLNFARVILKGMIR